MVKISSIFVASLENMIFNVINIYSFFNDFFSFDIANNVINIGDFLMKFILFDRFDMMCQKQTGFAIDQHCIASVIMG